MMTTNGKRTKTYSLFARPSFLEGMARLLDMGNALNSYNGSRSPSEADAKALASDWTMVGRDIRQAMGDPSLGNRRNG